MFWGGGGGRSYGDKILQKQCETPVLLTEKLNYEDSNAVTCNSCYRSTCMKSFFKSIGKA
jgi:hypothetical protein